MIPPSLFLDQTNFGKKFMNGILEKLVSFCMLLTGKLLITINLSRDYVGMQTD